MKVAVHNGVFHADEVFAIAILRQIYTDLEVIRTRDEQELAQVAMRIDVGGKYDPDSSDFDHHQTEGAGMRENGIKYASAGLIWKHFGTSLVEENDSALLYVDEQLFQSIDAGDNGQKFFESILANPYDLHKLIGGFNPNWQEESPNYDQAFNEAVDLAERILLNEIRKALGLAKADTIVREAIKEADDDYLVLPIFCPWQKIVVKETQMRYVIYPAASGDQWVCRTVPEEPGGFDPILPFPKEWGGLREEELQKICGVNDAVFSHRNGFIAIAKSKEGAIALAKASLSQELKKYVRKKKE